MRKIVFLGWPIVALATATGCSTVGLLNTLIPEDGYTLEQDIAYGELPRQRLDVYIPDAGPAAASGPRKVVVFFYGGSWRSGDKSQYLFAAQALASKGWIAVLPDYRLYPQVEFPVFVEDGAEAVRWVYQNIGDYGGDPSQVYLMGHSAGAHIAALLTYDESYRVAKPAAGFIGLAGPYDFLPLEGRLVRQVFAAAPELTDTQPIHFADAGAPRSLLLAGAEDNIVEPGNARRLAAALRQAGAEVRVRVYPELGHRRIIGALAKPLRGLAPVLEDIEAFINRS